MKLNRLALLITILAFLLSGCSLPFLGSRGISALSIKTTPTAKVFLDDTQIGSTPFYDEKMKPGEYTLKLVPEDEVAPPWESRIILYPNISTIVSREIAQSNEHSSGYTLSLEPHKNNQASMLIITVPDGAVVIIDGQPKGISPVSISSLPEGDHSITISSPGYTDKSVKAILKLGYQLTANIQLAKNDPKTLPSPTSTATAATDTDEDTNEDTEEPEEKAPALDSNLDGDETPAPTKNASSNPDPPYVVIESPDTGWLNVRENPTTAQDNIIQKVDTGEKFAYLDKNDTGWYQIELPSGEKGWISSRYAKLVSK